MHFWCLVVCPTPGLQFCVSMVEQERAQVFVFVVVPGRGAMWCVLQHPLPEPAAVFSQPLTRHTCYRSCNCFAGHHSSQWDTEYSFTRSAWPHEKWSPKKAVTGWKVEAFEPWSARFLLVFFKALPSFMGDLIRLKSQVRCERRLQYLSKLCSLLRWHWGD